jgi:hypothetical protein
MLNVDIILAQQGIVTAGITSSSNLLRTAFSSGRWFRIERRPELEQARQL